MTINPSNNFSHQKNICLLLLHKSTWTKCQESFQRFRKSKKMSNHPLINYLNKSIIVSNEEELLILSKVKSRKYLKGQFIVQQGDTCRYLSFVVLGTTRTFHIDDKGKEHTFRFAIKNWWAVDLPSFFEQNAANTNVQCLENTETVQVSFQSLEELCVEIPKLERLFRILFQKVSISLEKRIINNLSRSAKERYLLFVKEHPDFEQIKDTVLLLNGLNY